MSEERAHQPKALIVCVSRHHGNTHRVASAMADELGAEVVDPSAVDVSELRTFDLIGFGSGLYFGVADPELTALVDRMPPGAGQRVFTFSTSGSCPLPWLGTSHLRDRLGDRHYEVLDDFNCRGLDTFGPLGWIGGINRGRPNARDLRHAAEFARTIGHRVTPAVESQEHRAGSRRP